MYCTHTKKQTNKKTSRQKHGKKRLPSLCQFSGREAKKCLPFLYRFSKGMAKCATSLLALSETHGKSACPLFAISQRARQEPSAISLPLLRYLLRQTALEEGQTPSFPDVPPLAPRSRRGRAWGGVRPCQRPSPSVGWHTHYQLSVIHQFIIP